MNMANVHREADALSPEAAKSLEDNTGLLEQLSIEIEPYLISCIPRFSMKSAWNLLCNGISTDFSERSKSMSICNCPKISAACRATWKLPSFALCRNV